MYAINYRDTSVIDRLLKDRHSVSAVLGYRVPTNLAYKMVDLLPETWFEPKDNELAGKFNLNLSTYTNNHRVLDICCNSGVLLYAFSLRFYRALEGYKNFSCGKELKQYIVKDLLYGVCSDRRLSSEVRRHLYGKSDILGNIYTYNIYNSDDCIDFKLKDDKVCIWDSRLNDNGGFKVMKFDVVCGNPPYNKDMYLDFVMLGHRLAKTYDLWITPAKFVTAADDYRAKSSVGYKVFRDSILNKISDLCFYPDALDLFNISQVDGIAYYLVGKDNVETCRVENKSLHNKQFNSCSTRDLINSRVLFNKGYELIKQLGEYDSFKPSGINKDGLYKVVIGTQFVTNGCGSAERKSAKIGSKSNIFNSDGTVTVVSGGSVKTEVPNGAYCCAFSSNDESECKNFISWLDTKFVRFLVLCNISKLTGIYTDDYFKFVPNPVSFGKIYEDSPQEGYQPDENGEYIDNNGIRHCSLYVKYKLSDEFVEVIESVIRARVSEG